MSRRRDTERFEKNGRSPYRHSRVIFLQKAPMRISEAQLRTWTTPAHFEEGRTWFEAGRVEHYTETDGNFEARLSIRDRAQICRFSVDAKGRCVNNCPCRVNRQEGLICGHVIAVMLAWRRDHADPLAERADRVERMMEIPASRRRHFRRMGESGIDAVLRLSLRRNWPEEALKGAVHVIPTFEVDQRVRRPDQLHPNQVLKLFEADQRLLILLEDISGAPLQPVFEVTVPDLLQLLDFRSPGEVGVLDWPAPIQLHDAPVLPMLTVDLVRESGELRVSLDLDLPRPAPAGTSPILLLSPASGRVVAGSHSWPLESVPPPELQGLQSGPVRIPRERVMPFLHEQLPNIDAAMLVDNRVPDDAFTEADVPPEFVLELKGGLEFASGVLRARYGEVEVIAGGPDPGRVLAIPDPDIPLAYGGRNPDAEEAALARLRACGFAATSGDRLGTLEGKTAILNLLSRARHEWEPLGWRVQLRGNLEAVAASARFLLARVDVAPADTPDWFRLDLTLRDSGGSPLGDAALRKALREGRDYLETADGLVLLPRHQTQCLVDTVAEAEPDPEGGLRLPKRAAGFVHARLAEAEGLPVHADATWMEEARSQNRDLALDPVDLAPELAARLRPYQDTGVRWLHRLEQGGYGGILGDDMGLGKTPQTLAWLSLNRVREEARERPALVVCPASLVENWAEEAADFVPGLTVLPIQGAKRDPLWDRAPEHDLVILSYGILRRDVQRAAAIPWSALVLDEAQHIKNPDTANAKSAKRLRADTRLVLSGTPMENQVRDLWSLMDFLMPGYLGTAASFAKRFGNPIAANGPGAATTLDLLRRKMKPFLLRRLKREVATDLPPRLERRMYCDLAPAQRRLYEEVEARVQSEADAARASGGAPLHILRGLMKLRQICGHPRLLPDRPNPPDESGKLDMFLEVLDESLDGGHRMLVFSQFTSMLGILREELERRKIDYRYLDGSTTHRQRLVNEFNSRDDIPVFLISLMAGGTGLNLTGADVVVHFDPWWNPSVEDQATDRAHRIGQDKTVYALKLVARDTVEARVADLQDRKRELVEAALSGDQAVMETLGWEDIRHLLDL